MTTKIGAVLAALAMAGLIACDPAAPVAEGDGSAALSAVAVRPFGGMCSITVAARVHDDEGGSCGGEEGEEPGGGPPIPRHYEIQGSCVLTLLGAVQVTGRLNLPGPFAPGGEAGEGALGARGRLAFVAANGDTLVGRYVPVEAVFTPVGGDGGTIAFTSTQEINESCEGGGGGGGGGGCGSSEGEEGCVEPVSTGRFVAATGQASLLGSIRIFASSKAGSGRILVRAGTLAY